MFDFAIKIVLEFVSNGHIDIKEALVQIMAWWRTTGGKP